MALQDMDYCQKKRRNPVLFVENIKNRKKNVETAVQS
jgi:hypothetical protein